MTEEKNENKSTNSYRDLTVRAISCCYYTRHRRGTNPYASINDYIGPSKVVRGIVSDPQFLCSVCNNWSFLEDEAGDIYDDYMTCRGCKEDRSDS